MPNSLFIHLFIVIIASLQVHNEVLAGFGVVLTELDILVQPLSLFMCPTDFIFHVLEVVLVQGLLGTEQLDGSLQFINLSDRLVLFVFQYVDVFLKVFRTNAMFLRLAYLAVLLLVRNGLLHFLDLFVDAVDSLDLFQLLRIQVSFHFGSPIRTCE